MIWFFALALAMQAAWHARAAGSALFPPVSYAALWAIILAGLALAGDVFYPMSLDTLGILLLGSLSFGLAGHLGLLLYRPNPDVPAPEYTYRVPVSLILNVGIVLLSVPLPAYWGRVQHIVAGAAPGDEFWASLRTEITESGGYGLGIFSYIGAFASFLAVLAVYDRKPGAGIWPQLRLLTLVALALAYHLGSGGRAESLILFFTLAALASLRSNRIRIGPIIVGALLATILFVWVAILLGKGANKDASVAENVGTMLPEIRHYLLSGTVAFDRYVRGTVMLPPGIKTLRFFYALASALGMKVQVPDLVMPFVDVPDKTNVYTMYLTYYDDFGLAGVILIPFGLGLVATILYQAARRGVPHCSILYAYFIGSLVLCNANDFFIMALSHWVQIVTYCFLVFRRVRGPSPAHVGAISRRFVYPLTSRLDTRV